MTSTKREAGRLSVVATPIGSLEDVTLRALRVLREADLVLAEDTRRTRTLCAHHGIDARLRSFHAHTPDSHVDRLLAQLLEGAHVALVTDAGTPLISDPGVRLVRAAREAGIAVETVPGPSAVTAALSVAGLRCDSFRFVGFLPRSGKRRRRTLERIAQDSAATVLFESPNRLRDTLHDLATHLGDDRPLAVCRELTKVHEEVRRGSASELAEWYREGTRGEVTVVVSGTDPGTAADQASDTGRPQDWDRDVEHWLRAGTTPRDAARHLAERAGLSRREAYRRVLRIRRQCDGDPADH